LTKYLLGKYPHKKWVIDAGALQMMEPEWLLPLKGNVVLTPHPQEFERVFNNVILREAKNLYSLTIFEILHGVYTERSECIQDDKNNY
jgi:NAD(P)H-hydrate repair Nnr-like enzyme with NAD(P)H-hydrate dehydratase domain